MSDFVKEVDRFHGYFVTRDGRLYVQKHRSMHGSSSPWWLYIKGEKTKQGYVRMCLTANGVSRKILLHVLVANAFLHKPDGADEVNHKDGDKKNNRADNLEWVTRQENMAHSWRMGLHKSLLGQNHPISKLTDDEVCEIKCALRTPYRGICADLATKYGVHRTTINKIKSGTNWTHL